MVKGILLLVFFLLVYQIFVCLKAKQLLFGEESKGQGLKKARNLYLSIKDYLSFAKGHTLQEKKSIQIQESNSQC